MLHCKLSDMGQGLKPHLKGALINSHLSGNIILINYTTDVVDQLYSTNAELDTEFFNTKRQDFATQTKEKQLLLRLFYLLEFRPDQSIPGSVKCLKD